MPAIDQTWAALIGALIGAVAGLGAAFLSSLRQEKAEHGKWLREQMQLAYSNALKTIAKSTIIPITNNIEELETWFNGLAEARETLVLLQVHSSNKARDRILAVSEELFQVIDDNDLTLIATQIATLEGKGAESSGFVTFGVARIRLKLIRTLAEITECARLDLGKNIKR